MVVTWWPHDCTWWSHDCTWWPHDCTWWSHDCTWWSHDCTWWSHGGHMTAHGGHMTAHGGHMTAHGGHMTAYGGHMTALMVLWYVKSCALDCREAQTSNCGWNIPKCVLQTSYFMRRYYMHTYTHTRTHTHTHAHTHMVQSMWCEWSVAKRAAAGLVLFGVFLAFRPPLSCCCCSPDCTCSAGLRLPVHVSPAAPAAAILCSVVSVTPSLFSHHHPHTSSLSPAPGVER